MKSLHVIIVISLATLSVLPGCSLHTPTIAHTHIGHAITGWHDTPDQTGLLTAAEAAAQAAVNHAELATAANTNLLRIKQHTIQVMLATKHDFAANTADANKYGVSKALTEAAQHIIFAAQSDDASANVKQHADNIRKLSQAVLQRCDLVIALGNEILKTSSLEEARVLASELHKLVLANRDGDDSNSDGVVGSVPNELGLQQIHKQIDVMIANEPTPYTPVETWYLFNLIKLPSGKWIFQETENPGY